MTHTFVHAIGLVFYFFLLWLLLQMAHASWGTRWASPKWIAMVNTSFMRAIRIKWLSVILAVAVAAQIALVIFMLGVSAWTGRPISFDQGADGGNSAPPEILAWRKLCGVTAGQPLNFALAGHTFPGIKFP